MVQLPVLVLNQNYEPLNVCQVRRAVNLLFRQKAEVIENGRGALHSISGDYEIPSVIRLHYFIKRPHRQRRMTKLEVFNRDKFTCQYCGWQGRELTIDHVVPRTSGGKHIWENVVSACVPCNRKKAGRTPDEAGMPLMQKPRQPKNDGFYVPFTYLRSNLEWKKYLRQ
jgi:5-methylcytosine-specific restriction endonuclease McrA